MVKNLKHLRTQKGISQQQLASVIGLSQQSVNKYENHNVEPDIATLIALADYFETSVDYLIGYSEVNKSTSNEAFSDLSEAESRIIKGYRKLNSAERLCIDTMIKTYLSLSEH